MDADEAHPTSCGRPLRSKFVTSTESARDSGQSSTNTSNTQQHSQQLSSRVAGIIHFNFAEWSAKNTSFCEHSQVGHQGLIGLFRFPVSMNQGFEARQSCQGLVPVPQKWSTTLFLGFILFLVGSWLSIMAAVIDH